MAAVEICDEARLAGERTAAGVDVVLILPEGVALPSGRLGPGRLAVFVAGTGDDTDRAWATAMGAEVFGA